MHRLEFEREIFIIAKVIGEHQIHTHAHIKMKIPMHTKYTQEVECVQIFSEGIKTSAIHKKIMICGVLNVCVETPTIASPFNGTQFTTNEETDITFTCIATGLPAPLISFSYEGQAITGDPRPMTSDPTVLDRVSLGNETTSMRSSGLNEVTRTLTLSNAAGEDLGEFMCNASVDMPGIIVGSTTVSFSLLVYRKLDVDLINSLIIVT